MFCGLDKIEGLVFNIYPLLFWPFPIWKMHTVRSRTRKMSAEQFTGSQSQGFWNKCAIEVKHCIANTQNTFFDEVWHRGTAEDGRNSSMGQHTWAASLYAFIVGWIWLRVQQDSSAGGCGVSFCPQQKLYFLTSGCRLKGSLLSAWAEWPGRNDQNPLHWLNYYFLWCDHGSDTLRCWLAGSPSVPSGSFGL